MNVDTGKYILKSDGLSMWIEQKYTGKNKNGEEKEVTKRVSGYLPTFQMLLLNFAQRKVRESEAESMKEVLNDLAEVEKDLQKLADGIGKELDGKVKK